MLFLVFLFVFFFGASIGSFLNVVATRFGTGRGIGGRSMCETSGKTLEWFELIPIFSFLFLRGRSRHTGAKISIQYLLVEFFTGLIFSLVFLKFGQNFIEIPSEFFIYLFFWFIAFSFLVLIFIYDYHHKIIPDAFSIPIIIMGFISMFLFHGNSIHLAIPTISGILAGPLTTLPLFLIWLFSKGKYLGFGDVKLQLGLGWLAGLSVGVAGLMLSFWLGSFIAIFLLAFKKAGFKSQIPLGPFLIMGFTLAFLYNIDMQSISNFFVFLAN